MSEDTDIPQPPAPSSGNSVRNATLALAIAALLVAAWQWQDGRQRINTLEQTLTDRLSQFEQRGSESAVRASLAEESSAKAAAKIALLEQQLDESRSQQEALQTLYHELANTRDERIISEVQQLVSIASEQLQLAGNIKSALLALQTADSRLQQLDKPQFIPLRKTLGEDIQRLQNLPSVDMVGMSLKLEALVDAADKLPLVSARHPVAEVPIMPDWDTNPWRRLAQEAWHDIRRMIRVERVDQPEVPLLAPEQAYFLRENLKLRLLAARLSLLQHDEATYRTDLHTVELWLKAHFDTRDSATQNALTALHDLLANDISLQLPDISESLNAVAKHQLALERGKP